MKSYTVLIKGPVGLNAVIINADGWDIAGGHYFFTQGKTRVAVILQTEVIGVFDLAGFGGANLVS